MAKRINGIIIQGRKIYADVSKPPDKKDNKNTLLLKNLPFNMDEDEVLDKLSINRADLVDVRFKKGFCYLQFKEHKFLNIYKKKLFGKELNKRKVVIIKIDATNEKPQKVEKSEFSKNSNIYRKRVKRQSNSPNTEKSGEIVVIVDKPIEPKIKTNSDFRNMFN